MISLVRADLLKLAKRPMPWTMLLISVGMVAAAMLIFVSLDVSPNPMAPLFTYPGGLLLGPSLIGQLGSLMMVVLGASLVGSEYGYDTWKNLLTRRPGRLPFIVVKWITLMIAVVIGIIVVALWSQGLALALGPLDTAAQSPPLSEALLGTGIYGLAFLAAGSIGMAFGLIGRSTVAGIIGGIVWSIVDSVASQLLPAWLSRYTFGIMQADLLAHAAGGEAQYSLAFNLAVLAVYLFVPLVVAAALFRRRDMAG